MSTSETVRKALATMTEDEYFAMSEDRKVVTPENVAGLLDYPALFRAMQDDRELRPPLSEAMYVGRAMNDFLSCTPEEFTRRYLVSDGPINQKTGKPYLYGSKAYAEWRAAQDREPVGTEQFAMFGRMAEAYGGHAGIAAIAEGRELVRNAVVTAQVAGVPAACKVDALYVGDGGTWAVDVKTCDDLSLMRATADRLRYREQQALVHLVLGAAGIDANVCIAAVEKGPMPRCGVFHVADMERCEATVLRALGDYAADMAAGKFRTGYEEPRGL